MDTAVLIPSFGRPDKLRTCLRGLCEQTHTPAEVIVGLDGGSEEQGNALREEFETCLPQLRVLVLPKLGYIPTRARLLTETRSPLFLSLNDDVRVTSGLLEAHARSHESFGGTALVTGPAPWVTPDQPTLFDRLVAHSDLIFFDPVRALDHGRPLSYRYCVGLNFSCRTEAARAVGGFHDLPDAYGYDDIELAYRVGKRFDAPVLFDREAVVRHDHRYGPREVANREYRLGRAAWAYREVNPAFTTDLFGRDIGSPEELEFAARSIEHGHGDAQRVERSFLSLGEQCPDAVDAEMLPLLAELWIPLKRYLWRRGLLAAAERLPERFSLITQADVPACGPQDSAANA